MTIDLQPLIVTDYDTGTTATFTADAAGYRAAFEAFCTDEQAPKLKATLDSGEFVESFSGKGTYLVQRDREPLRFWTQLCSWIETDNQIWSVGPVDTGEDA